VTTGKEVLFAGHEGGNSKPDNAWLVTGRWKLSQPAVDAYLNGRLSGRSFGTSVNYFVFCLEIADFEQWGQFFRARADYISYRPKRNEIWSVGQLRWSDVKDLAPADQLQALRSAIQTAIERVGEKKRKPRDFEYLGFAAAVDELLKDISVEA